MQLVTELAESDTFNTAAAKICRVEIGTIDEGQLPADRGPALRSSFEPMLANPGPVN